jgi:hypothetical protein
MTHKGGGEAPVRLVAGYVLLAGICSLIVSQERLPTRTLAWQSQSVTAGRETGGPGDSGSTRKPAMDSQDRTTVFAWPEMRTTAVLSGPVDRSQAWLEPAGSRGAGRPGIVGEGMERVEHVIRQYPWPTLLFGVGLGFLLARRMR